MKVGRVLVLSVPFLVGGCIDGRVPATPGGTLTQAKTPALGLSPAKAPRDAAAPGSDPALPSDRIGEAVVQ